MGKKKVTGAIPAGGAKAPKSGGKTMGKPGGGFHAGTGKGTAKGKG